MAKVSLRTYNREIETMIDRGHLDEAIAHCQFILKTFPKHLETYRLLGKAYLEARRYNEAVDIFSRVLAAEPSDFVAQVGMSIIRDEQDKLDDAIWHMERAFETQPSNAAIQGELQRLYGRRDGVQPPRIRMTRGALAHMYMQGELYPQAISETRNVLQEDPGRSDMQALLAKAYYRSGQKNDAADAASSILKRYPYCLDANRVMTEILGSDRPESAQVYRRRVIELDPYAAQVAGTVFQASDVGDAAVTLDHLEWSGQQGGVSSDWTAPSSLGSGTGTLSRDREIQPEWLRKALPEEKTTPPAVPAFVAEKAAPSTPALPADDLPDFLRAAGWGASTGAFDESKSSTMFTEEPSSAAQPIEQGDLPDWVRAMAPQGTLQQPQEEEMPDWINKIGTGELPVPSAGAPSQSQPDWLSGLGEPSETQPASEQPDWLKGFSQEEQPAPSSDKQSNWLNSYGQQEQPAAQPDWMSQIGRESEQPAPAMDINNLGTSAQEQDDSFAWLENLAAKQGATEGLLTKPEERLEQEPEWVKRAMSSTAPPPQAGVEDLGKSEAERDDSFAWLENLAARQGATEGLLTKPEERLDQEPEWVKQAKTSAAPQPVPPPPAKIEDLGKSQAERDDSFAWLENLAAKQGATEGLLTKPEERLEQEPEWVKQAKAAGTQAPSAQEPEAEEYVPADDVTSWLRDLDKEEESQEPTPVVEDVSTSWLKSLDEPEEVAITSADTDDMPAWMKSSAYEPAPDAEPAVPAGEVETSAWMSAVEEPAAVPVTENEDIPSWLSGLAEEEKQIPVISAADDLPSWMRDETGEVVAEPTRIQPTRSTDWHPVDEKEETEAAPPPASQPAAQPQPEPSLVSTQQKPAPETRKKPAPRKAEVKPATPPEPYKEPVTRRALGSAMPVDPVLGAARAELSRSNIPGALETYEKLIKKGRFLEEVIYDLREALYRYPVEVSIWQTLGDAYMRANQLQEALDAYTKAEELLR